jgi:hypothetical protein
MKMTLLFSCLVSASLLGCTSDAGMVGVTVQGNGKIVSNPQGIECDSTGGDCDALLGASYVLYAEPAAGAHLDHWEGDELCTRRGQAAVVVTVTPEHKVKCTAVFADGSTANTP